jgi:alpha-ribazole phosphatase
VLHWLDEVITAAPAAGAETPGQRVVVAHGGPLRTIAGHLLGLPPERWLGLDFGCGQVTRIDVEPWGVVLKWFNR